MYIIISSIKCNSLVKFEIIEIRSGNLSVTHNTKMDSNNNKCDILFK